MSDEIYRILYCSRNMIQGSLDQQINQVRNILDRARVNNAARDVTGALLFNAGYFAQVLEGPLEEVEYTFEKIQRDSRHAEVVVLEANYVPSRDFPSWSMAFAGSDQDELATFSDCKLKTALQNTATAAEQVRDLLRQLVMQEDDFVQSR